MSGTQAEGPENNSLTVMELTDLHKTIHDDAEDSEELSEDDGVPWTNEERASGLPQCMARDRHRGSGSHFYTWQLTDVHDPVAIRLAHTHRSDVEFPSVQTAQFTGALRGVARTLCGRLSMGQNGCPQTWSRVRLLLTLRMCERARARRRMWLPRVVMGGGR